MTGKTVIEHSHSSYFSYNVQSNVSEIYDDFTISSGKFYTPLEVVSALTFTVAIVQVRKNVLPTYLILIYMYIP